MRPDDTNASRPTAERPFRVLIIAGSGRRQYNCPGVDSKARTLMLRMAERLPQEWEIDYEDLGNVFGRARIQSCNACVSTSMALCVWPCNCYTRNDAKEPDLMWDLDLYARFDMADAWAIIGPVNWYGPTSNLKALFDRMVCMNGGNPDETTIRHKDPEAAMALEHDEVWPTMSLNHLEGRTAGFFCYGDGGGDELDVNGRPKILRHPAYFDPPDEPFDEMRQAYAPLVWQCRYGGIEVPDRLWQYVEFGVGEKYSDNQAEDMVTDQTTMAAFDSWTTALTEHVSAKGKVPPGKYRAYGHVAPSHLLEKPRMLLRNLRMMSGTMSAETSPGDQEQLGLNDDATWHRQKSEGEKLRE